MATRWLRPFARPQTWLLVAANLLPLLGIVGLGWDSSTLIILYWLETAILGFWLFVRLAIARDEDLPPTKNALGQPQPSIGGVGLGLFLLVHAGFFMGIHMHFLTFLAAGEWSRHLSSPVAFMRDFVLPSGIWLPLAGLFTARGVITIGEIRARRPAQHLIAGFYARVVLMQFVIIFGGMVALMAGNAAPLLVLVVGLKIAGEVYWDDIAARFIRAAETAS